MVLAAALALASPVLARGEQCPDDGTAPVRVEVTVTAVPIVVTSTTADYFVLYAKHDVDGTEVELPVLVKLGEVGTTTLAENVPALPANRYSVLATSNLVERGQLLMSNEQLRQLREHLEVIHDHFEALYNPAPAEPFAMEIEFKITSENILAIKQARPWVFEGSSSPPPPPPVIDTIEITSNPGPDATYAAGDTIEVTVTFDETVAVTRMPQLTLNVGGVDQAANYGSGTGAALVFAYPVADSDLDTDGVSIEANRLSLNGGTIKDGSNNNAELDHDGLAADSGHKVDAVRPELAASGGVVVNGTTLTLTFDETLDGSSTPAAGDFTVPGGSQSRTVTGVRVSGSTVLLTLNAGAEHLETGILVSYTLGMKPIRDVPGNEVEALSRESVRNDTPDTSPPKVESVAISSNPGSDRTYVEGDEIQVTVTFSETVEVTGTPRLQIELGGGSRTADYQGGSGTAALVFGYEVAEGESDTDGVGVEADSLTGGTIRDEARNNAELDHDGLAADSGHKVDAVRPELAASGGAVVNGTTLTLTFDETLDGSSTPAAGDFTVAGGGRARTVSRVVVRGAAVELTLNAGAEHLEAGILVSYTPGMKPIRDVPGNEVEALSRESVRNDTPDTSPPKVESVAISSNPGSDRTYAVGDEIEVMVTFSETVEVEGTPRLRLRVGTRTRTAGYLRGTGTAVLVFGYEVVEGDEDSDGVSIDAGRVALNGGTIKDEAENSAELAHGAVAPQAGHKVDGVRPSFLSAAVDGSSLTLTYGEALDGGSRPASGDFTVQVDGAGRSVSGVSVSGSVVTLTLNPAVEHGDTGIRVSYTVPTGVGANPIQDAVGNDARGLNNQSVTNLTGGNTHAQDSEALVALYNATGGANWTNNTNWLSNEALSEWHGVTTDADDRVTRLDLSRNMLSGEIPVELGNLTSLQELYLWGNELSGEIPVELGNLTNLQLLSLSRNGLSGEIPVELGNLTSLQELSLSNWSLSPEWVERGDPGRTGKSDQPPVSVSLPKWVERGDPGRAGKSDQPPDPASLGQ